MWVFALLCLLASPVFASDCPPGETLAYGGAFGMPICERVHRALAVDAVADNAGGPYASTTTVTHIGDSTVRILGSHTLTPTTDDSGNSIYVTRTGVYAASSTTAHLTMPVATTTSSMGLSAITKFVTSTVTKTVLDLGTTTVPITASVQSLNDGTVLKVAGFPQATIIPLNVDWEEFYDGESASFPTLSSGEYHATVAQIDGHSYSITKPTQTINHGSTVLVVDPLAKYKAYDPRTHAVAPTGSCSDGRNNTHDCKVDRCMWQHMRPIAITTAFPAAVYGCDGVHYDDYVTMTTTLHYPHWGTTVTEGLYYPAHLHQSTARDGKTFCKVTRASPTPATPVFAVEGRKVRPRLIAAHGDPDCHNAESCYAWCNTTHPHLHDILIDPRNLATALKGDLGKWAALLLFLPLLLLSLLLCCCCCGGLWLLGSRRDNRERKSTLMALPEKLRRMSTKKPEDVVVVNEVTGTATNVATGEHVDPALATAVVAGAAAGAAAATEKAGSGGEGAQVGNTTTVAAEDDGRGTTGRRAEEGRGRVNFEDGGHPGTEARVVPVDAPAAAPAAAPTAAPVEHTEPVPVHDGSFEPYTAGRQMVDTGSVRGRKRARPEGGLLNLAF